MYFVCSQWPLHSPRVSLPVWSLNWIGKKQFCLLKSKSSRGASVCEMQFAIHNFNDRLKFLVRVFQFNFNVPIYYFCSSSLRADVNITVSKWMWVKRGTVANEEKSKQQLFGKVIAHIARISLQMCLRDTHTQTAYRFAIGTGGCKVLE